MLHGHGSFRLPSSVMHPAGIGSLVMFVTIILCSTSEPADSERLTTDRRNLFFLTDLSGRRALFPAADSGLVDDGQTNSVLFD